ncbi:MAG: uroporphyrinogen decarboxylase family protein [Planctomycetes bacterium]|nr:uroporphyrinogen decarboxylase family protein [Planctomycetota bacterium]
MNSLQRVVAAVTGGPIDRPPVLPVLLQQGARELGMSLREYFQRPTRLAEGQTRLIDHFGHDGVFAFPHVVQDTLPWGAPLRFSDEGPPSVDAMVIRRYEEIPDLRVPDPTSHEYLRHTLESARSLAAEFKGEKLIVGAVIGPFSLPTLLMGTGKFLSLIVQHDAMRERYLEPLLETMFRYTTRWANAQLEAGCDIVVIAEGIASASVIQENTFLKHALPLLDRTVRAIDGLVGVELVGDALPFARHLRHLPCAVLLIGSGDAPDAMRAAIGPDKALMGNLNNLELIRWEPDRVEFEAHRLLDLAGDRFILSNQGPEIPWAVPTANIEALIRVAQRAPAPA